MSKQSDLARVASGVFITASNEQDGVLVEQSDGTDVGSLRINNGSFILKGKNSSQPVQIQTHDGNEDIEVDPDGFIKMETAGSERLRIDASGRILIGHTSSISNGGDDQQLQITGTGSSDGISLARFNTDFGAYFTIGRSGSGTIGTYTAVPNNDEIGRIQWAVADGTDMSSVGASISVFTEQTAASNDVPSRLVFSTTADGSSSPTERMRIDSSGNLLVGKSTYNNDDNGAAFVPNGTSWFTATNDYPLGVNRKGSTGTLVTFTDDQAGIGTIGVASSYLTIGKNDTGLVFNDGDNGIQPWNVSTNSGRDNGIDLGHSNLRFDDIYATNGTIQTSDRNEKQDIAELTDAEQRVAVAAKGLLRKFRWKSAVEEKGEAARTHFGIIAQDLQAAFAAEGLDAGDYAMFISSTWTDEETGEERTRLGVRYSELLAFIIGAL